MHPEQALSHHTLQQVAMCAHSDTASLAAVRAVRGVASGHAAHYVTELLRRGSHPHPARFALPTVALGIFRSRLLTHMAEAQCTALLHTTTYDPHYNQCDVCSNGTLCAFHCTACGAEDRCGRCGGAVALASHPLPSHDGFYRTLAELQCNGCGVHILPEDWRPAATFLRRAAPYGLERFLKRKVLDMAEGGQGLLRAALDVQGRVLRVTVERVCSSNGTEEAVLVVECAQG